MHSSWSNFSFCRCMVFAYDDFKNKCKLSIADELHSMEIFNLNISVNNDGMVCK